MMISVFEIPVNVISELNWRGHRMERHRRLKKHKDSAYGAILMQARHFFQYGKWDKTVTAHITLIRVKGPRQRDFDGDNLQASMKGVRDGIAMALHIDDGSKRLAWEYRQEKGGKPGVRVEIRENI
jgi:hypothetical protein